MAGRTRKLLRAAAENDKTFERVTTRGREYLVGKCIHCQTSVTVPIDWNEPAHATLEHIIPRGLVRPGHFFRDASLVPGFHSVRVLLERGAAIPSSPTAPVKTGSCVIHHERSDQVVLGGSDDPENLAVACRRCNHLKGTRLDQGRRGDEALERVIERLQERRRARTRS